MPKFIDHTLPDSDQVRPALVIKSDGKHSEVLVFLSASDPQAFGIDGVESRLQRVFVENSAIYQDVSTQDSEEPVQKTTSKAKS